MLESVAELHSQNQRYDQAVYFYSLALEKLSPSEKTDPTEKERLFMCIAQSHVNNKNYNEALVYYLKVLSSKSTRLEFNSSEIIQVIDKILSFCDTLQACQKCIDSLEKSLLLSHNYSKDQTYPKLISKLYETIASIYRLQKDFPNAIKYFEKSIQVITTPTELVESYSRLASIYLEQKSENNALSLLQKGLDILLKSPKEENYEKTEKFSQELGSLFLQKKEYSLAIQNYRICLETKMKRFGLAHSELVSTLNIIADIYYQQENYNDALVCYHQSYRMIVKTGLQQQEETQLIQVYWKIGLIYKQKKSWSEALKYFSKTLKTVKSTSQTSKEKLIPIYKEIGEVYYNMGKFEDSIKFFKKAIKTEKELLGDSSSNHLEIYLKIVNLYELLGEYKKAHDFLLQLFLLQKKLFGDYNLCTQATLGRLQTINNKIKEIQ